MLRKILQQLDRKREIKNIDFKSFSRKQVSLALSWVFATDYLESWQVLMALANNPTAWRGSALNEFPIEVDKLEEAASDITEKEYQKTKAVLTYCLSHRLEGSSLSSRADCRSRPC